MNLMSLVLVVAGIAAGVAYMVACGDGDGPTDAGSTRRVRMLARSARLALVVAGVVVLRASAAFGDDEEASVHVELGGAAVRTGDTHGTGGTDTVPGVRLSLRGTWGLTDTWAFEVSVGGIVGGVASYPGPMLLPGSPSTYRERPAALRVTTGLTARLGVQWIPTVSMFGGYQLRFATGREQLNRDGAVVEPFGMEGTSDLVVGLGVGLDHRFGARWVGGVSIQVVHAFSLDGEAFDAIEVPVWLGYYWYPRW
jgi:hypothetical protein